MTLPTSSDRDSLLQVASNGVHTEDATQKPWSSTDWQKRLLKDIPDDPYFGRPLVKVSGLCPIEIGVGQISLLWGEEMVPYLQARVRDILAPKYSSPWKCFIDAQLYSRYLPLDIGFLRLGEVLAFLGEGELPFQWWDKLNITLPDIELPYEITSPPLLPLDSFLNLRSLTWKGHRNQLVASWLPFSPSILRMLTTLEIQCDISVWDCCHMLYYGENLKEFTVKIIQRDLSTEQVLDFVPPSGCTSRPLEYMCLVSDDDIGPLLLPFDFPNLRRVHLTLAYRTLSKFSEWKIWNTLEKILLRCDVSLADQRWIISQCRPATKFYFQPDSWEIQGASSFIHNHDFKTPFFSWRPDQWNEEILA